MTKYYKLFQLLKSAGNKGATVSQCAKELNFALGSVGGYVVALRQKFGAEIEPIKNGRSTTGYRLLNVDAVEAVITPKRRGAATKSAKVVKTKAVKVKKVAKVAKTKTTKVSKSDEMPVELDSMEIEEITDSELSDIKAQLGLV